MKKLIICFGGLFAIGTLFFVSCKKNMVDKTVLNPELLGTWENSAARLVLNENKTGSYNYYASNGVSFISEDVSGNARSENNVLTINLKKFTINSFPSTKSVSSGAFNTFMVLNNDTLYKPPFIYDPCSNGMQDIGEDGTDCGGNCKPCPSCYDGIKNQDEDETDCGGICEWCPNCEDGKKNQTETGIDCGGVCEPCATNACSTALGFGENFYLPNGKAAFVGTSTDSTGSGLKVEVTLNFNLSNTCKQYLVSFYESSFLYMPLNTTQVFTIDYDSENKANKCQVEIFMQMANLNAFSQQKVYVKRISATTFNLKFCDLSANIVSPYNSNTKYSANVNFIL